MGHYHNSNTGYGIVVLNDANQDKNLVDEVDAPLVTEFVGDSVLGEDEGFFFMSKDVMIDMSSSTYISEYIEQHDKFQVSPALVAATQKIADEMIAEGVILTIGAFTISNYG